MLTEAAHVVWGAVAGLVEELALRFGVHHADQHVGHVLENKIGVAEFVRPAILILVTRDRPEVSKWIAWLRVARICHYEVEYPKSPKGCNVTKLREVNELNPSS